MITTIRSRQTGSNCYILSFQNHSLVIDPDDTSKILTFFKKTAFQPEKILLTHEHFDHIGAIDPLRDIFDIPLICSKKTSENITNSNKNLSIIYDLYVYEQSGIISTDRHPPFQCRPAEITFEENYFFSFFSHSVTLTCLPGHSPGSTIIQLDQNIFFTGDYCIDQQPDNLKLPGSDPEIYSKITLPVLRSLPYGSQIYPGHGRAYRKIPDESPNR